jgi:hypothetical protein
MSLQQSGINRVWLGNEKIPSPISQLESSASNRLEKTCLLEIGCGPTDTVIESRLPVLQQLPPIIGGKLESLRQ